MNITLEYLKLFLAWPPITLASVIFVSLLFKKPLSQWLSNLKIKYGGAEVSSLFQQRSEPVETKTPTTETAQNAALTRADEKQADASIELPKENEALKELVQQYRAGAYIWEYRYLNLFLVYNSKRVLTWLVDYGKAISIEVAAGIWSNQLPTDQRDIIVEVLRSHSLIIVDIKQGTLEATPKGKEFVDFIGRVPVGNLVSPA